MYVERIDPMPIRGSMLFVSSGIATTSSASGSAGCAPTSAPRASRNSSTSSQRVIEPPPSDAGAPNQLLTGRAIERDELVLGAVGAVEAQERRPPEQIHSAHITP